MNYNRVIKKGLYVALLSLSGLSMVACQENIEMSNQEDLDLSGIDGVYVSLKNNHETRLYENINVYLSEAGEAEVSMRLSRKADQIVDLKLVVDKTLVDEYNTANGTEFECYPAELLSLENEGVISIAPGDLGSESLKITINHSTSKSLAEEVGRSYMLPIAVEAVTEGVKVMDSKANYLYIVKPQGNRPNTDKGTGIVTNMYFEVNDTNILNAKEWTMAKSGKPMADIVCIFAANINYNSEEGRVFLNFNENVSHVLNNRDKYIKPLQDMGIKVTMAILGNHDAASVKNLSPETCIRFAQQLKDAVDAYGLDGIEFDDEYSETSQGNGVPGFVAAGSEPYVNLIYETRRLMPDKIIGVYHYGAAGGGAWDKLYKGMSPSMMFDYAYEAYYGRLDDGIAGQYYMMENKQVSPYSRKISDNPGYTSENMQKVRNDGYGCQMIYNYNIRHTIEGKQEYVEFFNGICEILFDEGIVYTGVSHKKDY